MWPTPGRQRHMDWQTPGGRGPQPITLMLKADGPKLTGSEGRRAEESSSAPASCPPTTGRRRNMKRSRSSWMVATGAERVVSLAALGGEPQGLAWLDSESLLANHSAQGGAPEQLWRLSSPGWTAVAAHQRYFELLLRSQCEPGSDNPRDDALREHGRASGLGTVRLRMGPTSSPGTILRTRNIGPCGLGRG